MFPQSEDFDYPPSVPGKVRRAFASLAERFTPDEVDRAITQMAVRMTVALQDKNPIFVTVLHGGSALAGSLQRMLVFPCQFGYVHVGRYGQETEGGEVVWKGFDVPEFEQRTVVFLDDILDEGVTLSALTRWATLKGAAEVQSAVLVSRQNTEVKADYCGLESGPGFLVGSGMDYLGYGRNLPGIYVLDDAPVVL